MRFTSGNQLLNDNVNVDQHKTIHQDKYRGTNDGLLVVFNPAAALGPASKAAANSAGAQLSPAALPYHC